MTADITALRNLNRRRERTYPRVVKRARHNSYRVKRPGDHGTRHNSPPSITLVNLKKPQVESRRKQAKWHCLLGRRRLFVAGTALFGLSSLVGGLADSQGVLIGARLAQGLGAAMMTPAALSILTTTFHEDRDRVKAIGVWAGTVPIASAAGVVLGGVLSEGPGWRWIFFVNIPISALVIAAAFRLLPGDRPQARHGRFDAVGAILSTAGATLLVYALVGAPTQGWSGTRTLGELVGALVLLSAFVVNERRHPNPLVPFSIFRIQGLAAADITQMLAQAGFISMFFFITLYMQNVLGFSPIQAGVAYLPVTAAVGIAAGLSTKLLPRVGTRR